MCDCISYNQPQPWQKTPSLVVELPEWYGESGKTVCIDQCIWPLIKSMWDAKIPTLNCCCGHNDPSKRGVIVHECDVDAAQSVADSMGDAAHILFWKLVAKEDLVELRRR